MKKFVIILLVMNLLAGCASSTLTIGDGTSTEREVKETRSSLSVLGPIFRGSSDSVELAQSYAIIAEADRRKMATQAAIDRVNRLSSSSEEDECVYKVGLQNLGGREAYYIEPVTEIETPLFKNGMIDYICYKNMPTKLTIYDAETHEIVKTTTTFQRKNIPFAEGYVNKKITIAYIEEETE